MNLCSLSKELGFGNLVLWRATLPWWVDEVDEIFCGKFSRPVFSAEFVYAIQFLYKMKENKHHLSSGG